AQSLAPRSERAGGARRKFLTCSLSEIPGEPTASTAEAAGLDCDVDGTCLGIDLKFLLLPLSRNRSNYERIKPSITVRARWIEEEYERCLSPRIPRRRRLIRGVDAVWTYDCAYLNYRGGVDGCFGGPACMC